MSVLKMSFHVYAFHKHDKQGGTAEFTSASVMEAGVFVFLQGIKNQS
jgi:hypothetical protein